MKKQSHSQQTRSNNGVQSGEGQSNIQISQPPRRVGTTISDDDGQGTRKPSLTSPADTFNLSKKEFYACSPPNSEEPFGRSCLSTDDVKEFIEILKKELYEFEIPEDDGEPCIAIKTWIFDNIIDKLSGEKLKK